METRFTYTLERVREIYYADSLFLEKKKEKKRGWRYSIPMKNS